MSEHVFFKHLREDHDEQKQLRKQLTGAMSPQEQDRLRQKFHDALYPLMAGEESSIFALCCARPTMMSSKTAPRSPSGASYGKDHFTGDDEKDAT